MRASYQRPPLSQNLRFNKLINNLSCVHRRAEVLGNVTGPAINTRAGYSDGGQMAPVPALSWLNNFPGGAFRTRGSFLLGEPLSHRPFFFCFQPLGKATVRRRCSASVFMYSTVGLPLNTSETPLHTCCAPSVGPLNHLCSPGFRRGRLAVYMFKLMCTLFFFLFPTFQPLRQRRAAAVLL